MLTFYFRATLESPNMHGCYNINSRNRKGLQLLHNIEGFNKKNEQHDKTNY